MMKVYTRYPALAPAIARAGFEPVLLEPLIYEEGPVKMEVVERIDGSKVVVVAQRNAPPVVFETGEPRVLELMKD